MEHVAQRSGEVIIEDTKNLTGNPAAVGAATALSCSGRSPEVLSNFEYSVILQVWWAKKMAVLSYAQCRELCVVQWEKCQYDPTL